jgi:hypothetical protein
VGLFGYFLLLNKFSMAKKASDNKKVKKSQVVAKKTSSVEELDLSSLPITPIEETKKSSAKE